MINNYILFDLTDSIGDYVYKHRHKHPPSPPRRVRLTLHRTFLPFPFRRKKKMAVTVQWGASLTGTPTSYSVVWTYNGVAQTPDAVALVPGQSVYSLDFASSTGIALQPGDVVGAMVQTIDAVNSLSSVFVSSIPVSVTVPSAPPPPIPPGAPQNVFLQLS